MLGRETDEDLLRAAGLHRSGFGRLVEGGLQAVLWGFGVVVLLAICVGGFLLKSTCYYQAGKAIVEEAPKR